MDLLYPSVGLLFWMSVVFFIVFLILWKFGFPAIVNMVNERKAFIDESLENARKANEKLVNIKEESESILQEARAKQAEILREAAATRDAIVKDAKDKADAEGAKIIEEARAQIQKEKEAAVADIRKQVTQLSVEVAEKILRKELASDNKQMDLISRLLDEVTVSK
ncbi:MAG: F0F1 ATP synthase subunit B [Bacteroidaceae bacterium]|jgi:F-type H+-transporting ATPase subunit b|uniref:F0F1 ATP synthase subunit B n=1 Tax=unclassified Bacteroides TaxID=2646097 RepID=UPI0004E1F13E|nr:MULTISPECIES: F0F1 ATP synthase subunit B [unclassified Bacteroides]MBR6368724.1 F0F1 ATP synthase subunit B [Bacteroidaceae bacterium]